MNRRTLRGFLIVALLVTATIAAWTWFRPYAWRADPAARCKIQSCHVRQDCSFFWLQIHLKLLPGEAHDLMKPVQLITQDGRKIDPADTTMGGTPDVGTSDLWFKFWVESRDIANPMKLKINDGTLVIRSNSGIPKLGASREEVFASHRW